MTKLARVVALMIAALLVTACGSGGGDAELTVGVAGAGDENSDTTPSSLPPVAGPVAGTASSACQALTIQEVAAALGNPVKTGTGEAKNCFWGTQVDRGSSVFLTVTKPASPQECTMQRNALPKEATQDDVKNLGGSAVWSWQKLDILIQGNLLVCFNDSVIAVLVTGEKEQVALRTAAGTLAQRAHSRL